MRLVIIFLFFGFTVAAQPNTEWQKTTLDPRTGRKTDTLVRDVRLKWHESGEGCNLTYDIGQTPVFYPDKKEHRKQRDYQICTVFTQDLNKYQMVLIIVFRKGIIRKFHWIEQLKIPGDETWIIQDIEFERTK